MSAYRKWIDRIGKAVPEIVVFAGYPDHPFVLIRTQKCACTTLIKGVVDWGLGLEHNYPYLDDERRARSKIVPRTDDYCPSVDEFEDKPRFMGIRSPYARTLSMYTNIMCHRPHWTIVADIKGLDADGINDYSFEHMLRDFEELQEKWPLFREHTWPLYDLAYQDGWLMIDKFIRTEKIEVDTKDALRSVGIQWPNSIFPHLNSTEHDEWFTYYDLKAKERVQSLYENDFEEFGYKR